MIIDCHGHYTTAPAPLGEFREAQKAALATDPDHVGEKGVVAIGDDEIRESLEGAQLRLQRERGTDLTLFSPRASWMGHHIGNIHTSRFWTEHCNELIRRVCDLYPKNFAPVCQLPQSPGAAVEPAVRELRRCVDEMGFVGANVNPDPSGGYWTGPALGDRYWYPLYEALCELDVPAMVHVSAACNPQFHTTGSHYLGADTTAFMQLLTSDVVGDFPDLRIEYQDADGRWDHDDIEVTTEHYRGGHASSVARSGFSCYGGSSLRIGGRSSGGGSGGHHGGLAEELWK